MRPDTLPTETPTAPQARRGHPLLAAAVVGAPLLILVSSLLHPAVEFSGESLLAGARHDPTAWFVVHVVAAAAALLGIAATFGLRTLVPGRGRRLATAAVALAMVSGPLLALAFAAEASVLRLAAEHPDPVAGAALAAAYVETPEFYAVGVALLLDVLGAVLIVAALLRSRGVPRWQVAAYVVAVVGTVVAAPGSPVGSIAFGALVVVSGFFAARISGLHPATRG